MDSPLTDNELKELKFETTNPNHSDYTDAQMMTTLVPRAIEELCALRPLRDETKTVLGELLEARECETCEEEDGNGRCENDDDDGQDCPCHGRVREAREEASRLLSKLIPGGEYGGA